jgi:hypothetical protein
MAYSGIYKPKNPQKYKGNPTRIIYRSMWEKKFMIFCDTTDSIIEWGSEEVIVPYRCPTDGRAHRYFPDFYIKVKNKEEGPNRTPKRKTAAWKREVSTFIKNQAKWQAAREFCEDRQMKFLILTEDHLKV